MSSPTESYLHVHYELRPAKQVERRMLIDALQLLAHSGFQIRDYQYTGMGSIYFVDFILMHRLLGIEQMLSVEYSRKIRKRVKFNRPFGWVNTVIKPIGDVIPTLSKDLHHILWLDYDGTLEQSHLQDIALAATYLPTGSILLLTVDVEPPTDEGPERWREYFESEGAEYFDTAWRVGDFTRTYLPRRNVDLIVRAAQSGLTGRTGVEFLPLFNFLYKDGHQMLTLGGMIGTSSEKRRVAGSALIETSYYRNSFDAEFCAIRVPRLTRKERQYLDAEMPCKLGWKPKHFELSDDEVTAYRAIYRYCPTYAELLL